METVAFLLGLAALLSIMGAEIVTPPVVKHDKDGYEETE